MSKIGKRLDDLEERIQKLEKEGIGSIAICADCGIVRSTNKLLHTREVVKFYDCGAGICLDLRGCKECGHRYLVSAEVVDAYRCPECFKNREKKGKKK